MARIEVDGRPATVEDVSHPALVNFGHYTSMQVRGRRVRGLGQHLGRLSAATRELFDADLDPQRVMGCVRRALADDEDASVRVNVYRPDGDGPVVVMVTVRPPYLHAGTPQRLRTVVYQRPVPHIKHVGSFAQTYYARLAEAQGYDDALLTDADGVVSETTIANVGFFVDGSVRWPDAPCLIGTTMALLGGDRTPVRVVDLPAMAGAFVANSNGVAPVSQVDELRLPVDDRLMGAVIDRFADVAWDSI